MKFQNTNDKQKNLKNWERTGYTWRIKNQNFIRLLKSNNGSQKKVESSTSKIWENIISNVEFYSQQQLSVTGEQKHLKICFPLECLCGSISWESNSWFQLGSWDQALRWALSWACCLLKILSPSASLPRSCSFSL